MLITMICAAPAVALAQSATANVSSQINEPASISVLQNLAFSISPQALNSGLMITTSAASGANANILVANGAAVSLSAPSSINVVRSGGTETITVRTLGPVGNVLNSPFQIVGLLSGGMLSFSIGAAVAADNTLVPGEYHGVLTVVAQYN